MVRQVRATVAPWRPGHGRLVLVSSSESASTPVASPAERRHIPHEHAGRVPHIRQLDAALRLARHGPNSAVAVPARAAVGREQRQHNRLGGHQRRVQAHRSGRGGASLGRAQEQAEHELRQAESRSALLLRQEHHDEGARQAIRVQVRLHRPGAAQSADLGGRGGSQRRRRRQHGRHEQRRRCRRLQVPVRLAHAQLRRPNLLAGGRGEQVRGQCGQSASSPPCGRSGRRRRRFFSHSKCLALAHVLLELPPSSWFGCRGGGGGHQLLAE